MSDIDNPNYDAALETILARAADDAAFRARALKDAAEAIKEATGLEVPPGTTVEFVEADQAWAFEDGRYTVPLPRSNDEELTDSELLDSVAGGMRHTPGTGSPYQPYQKQDNPNAV